jgi:hypothetical protein
MLILALLLAYVDYLPLYSYFNGDFFFINKLRFVSSSIDFIKSIDFTFGDIIGDVFVDDVSVIEILFMLNPLF